MQLTCIIREVGPISHHVSMWSESALVVFENYS